MLILILDRPKIIKTLPSPLPRFFVRAGPSIGKSFSAPRKRVVNALKGVALVFPLSLLYTCGVARLPPCARHGADSRLRVREVGRMRRLVVLALLTILCLTLRASSRL